MKVMAKDESDLISPLIIDLIMKSFLLKADSIFDV